MTLDRRLTPATDRIALECLAGVLERPAYTPGNAARLVVPLADLMTAPDGRRAGGTWAGPAALLL